jgi:hypothetical protein
MVPLELEKNIIKTVAWFSLFDYPMTVFEIWKWLGVKCSLAEVETTLRESLWLRGRLVFQNGYFALGGHSVEVLITTRQERFLDAARKFKKLYRTARYFSIFPFVRAVFACNTLAWHHTAPGSDIDLFIVVEPGTIWLTRLLLVLPFAVFRKRPLNVLAPQKTIPPGRIKDPFCFSFFVTADALSLESLLLPEGDPYMAYWLASLVPIFDRGEIQKRLRGENGWLSKFLPNIDQDSLATIVAKPSFLKTKSFEKLAKFLQLKFLPPQIKTVANLDSRVIISDTILKFHLNDRRVHFREDWKRIYEAYGAG